MLIFLFSSFCMNLGRRKFSTLSTKIRGCLLLVSGLWTEVTCVRSGLTHFMDTWDPPTLSSPVNWGNHMLQNVQPWNYKPSLAWKLELWHRWHWVITEMTLDLEYYWKLQGFLWARNKLLLCEAFGILGLFMLQ